MLFCHRGHVRVDLCIVISLLRMGPSWSCYIRFVVEIKDVSEWLVNPWLRLQTPLDDIPYALCAFQGRLLVGMGKSLRIYDMGKKKLLRKCENKVCGHDWAIYYCNPRQSD